MAAGHRNDQLLLFLLALLVGAAAGYGALAFRLVTPAIQILFLGQGSDHLVSAAAKLPWWQVLLAPSLGACCSACSRASCCPAGCRRAWPTSWQRARCARAA